ncbi:microfibrillar-associated protein 1 isoform X2 [Ixodes scapularis]|uniref:microfibrillar-associated protein 1 isoform X2 n=1 Tax=Ixodes scapularis TaxID=6945 RepID=UPI001A9D8A23|nr:microfibrillar-associated protein 1 isoform X2 [Ixodes scapularis]
MSAAQASNLISSTAGAIPVLNDKGELSMQKVKVHRYVSGRRPKYAPKESSDEESGDEFTFERRQQPAAPEPIPVDEEAERSDPRLRRLQRRERQANEEERMERHRMIHEPEVLAVAPEGEEPAAEEGRAPRWRDEEEDSEGEDLDEEEMERRRLMLRQRALARAQEEELLDLEEEGRSDERESDESEYEEYTDSEEEETGPRLKPVFVRKRDRVTIQERERLAQKEKELEQEAKKVAEDRRRTTLKIVEDEAKKELMEEKKVEDAEDWVNTDDENDEAAYEAWKLRELRRIKRDKDEKEQYERERMEVERMHSMTEEERRAELRANPRVVTNKASKGKYKFLQKYYHRGAFFLEQEDNVYKRDFSAPTLEDHFDKTILPKVMQVKNFGRSGRTKYTHLVDQDTTLFDSPWMSETAQNLKFHANQAGGMKQVFDRPTAKKRKTAPT